MRRFYMLWGGQSLSCLGSYLTSFCLKVWIIQQSPSLTVSALTTVFTELPSILLSPFAGFGALPEPSRVPTVALTRSPAWQRPIGSAGGASCWPATARRSR